MKHSLKKQFITEFKSFANSYPVFVNSSNKRNNIDGIPVFVYHSFQPDLFEQQLIYLRENNYTTLSIDEYYEDITNGNVNNNSVLFTVDDGRLSFWKYAYPLLKKHKMKATLFVIPGVTTEGKKRPNLDSVWDSKICKSELESIDPGDDDLCNWNEIKEMYGSGYVNIENHTLFHKEVFINKNIIDFVNPNTISFKYNSEFSPYFNSEMINKEFDINDYLGLPIFEKQPLMECHDHILPNGELLEFCREFYMLNSKDDDWKNKLYLEIKEKNIITEEKFTTVSGTETAKNDLKLARKLIQDKLGSNAGNHLCLPWTRGNIMTINVCKEIGIRSIFWGALDTKRINKPGDDPYFNTRIKNDFIMRLPGKGRKSLINIYLHKVFRRLKNEKVY